MSPTFVNGGPYRPSTILLKNKKTDFDAIIIMDNSFGYRGEVTRYYHAHGTI